MISDDGLHLTEEGRRNLSNNFLDYLCNEFGIVDDNPNYYLDWQENIGGSPGIDISINESADTLSVSSRGVDMSTDYFDKIKKI